MASPQKASVLIADSEPVSRCGVAHVLASHPRLRVCAEADTLPTARELCARHKPALLLIDLAMGDGLAFIKDLPRWSPATRVVAFTSVADALSVQRAFKAGACGYITRRDPIVALLAALIGALNGELHVGPRVEHVLLERLACGAVEMHDHAESGLSNRELEVFRLLGNGLGTRAVAVELRLSVKTIETHRQRIKEKLRLATGAELQQRAVLFSARKP